MKYTEQYREREPSQDIPNPIQLTPKSLNDARVLARKGMTQITEITKSLVTDPSLAGLDPDGQPRKEPYMWPGELKKRMPVRSHGLTIREQADLVRRDTNFGLLSSEEVGRIGRWARDEDLDFLPLVGDHVVETQQHSWFGKNKDSLFCTLDSATDGAAHPENISKLRVHAHEDRSINWLGVFGRQTRSKRSHGHVSAIGFSTSRDTTTTTPRPDGVHRVVGTPNKNHLFWSQPLADFKYSKPAKVRIEYVPGSGCLAALVVLDASGQELTGWKQYGQAKMTPAGLSVVEQGPPDKRSGWVLAGFWGHSDGMVIRSVGAIWRK